MFDLAKAFADTYNPKSGLYLRKDRLESLVPDSMQDLRKKIRKLIKSYPAKLTVRILTEGYPSCPVCQKVIKIPNMCGSKRDEFIKTCGSKRCQSQYLSLLSPAAQSLLAKARGTFDLLPSYLEVLHLGDYAVKVRCTRCGRKSTRSSSTAERGCSCSKGEKSNETKSLNSKAKRLSAVEELKASLPPTVKCSGLHKHRAQVLLRCTLCDKKSVRWLCNAKDFKCSCETEIRQQARFEGLRCSRDTKVKEHLADLGMSYLSREGNSKYKVKCHCGKVFVPYNPLALTYGCQSCTVRSTTDARQASMKATNLERYGVPYAVQDPTVLRKLLEGRYKFKEVSLGDRVVRVQGFEDRAINHLLSVGVPPTAIKVGSALPTVRYNFEGITDRVYHPDIMLDDGKRKPILIEVKSTWTLRMDLPRILAKQKAALASGYDFRFMIMATNGGRLNTKAEIANAKTYRRQAS